MGWRWITHPLEGIWDQWKYNGMEMGYLPAKDMGPVEVLWDGDGVPPLPGGEKTENITSRCTTHAGGNNNGEDDNGHDRIRVFLYFVIFFNYHLTSEQIVHSTCHEYIHTMRIY